MKKIIKYSGIVFLALITSFLFASHIPKNQTNAYEKSFAVELISKSGTCSGEQIQAPSGISYILSAAHCINIAKDGVFDIIKEDGTHIQRRLIAEDSKSDLILIEGLPGMTGLKIALNVSISDHVTTYTHGRGLPTYKTEGHLLGFERIQVPIFSIKSQEDLDKCNSMSKYKPYDVMFGAACVLEADELVTDALIVPGSSGGMILNDSGELVGVASATGGGLSYMVMLADIRAFVAGVLKSEYSIQTRSHSPYVHLNRAIKPGINSQ